MNGCEFWGAEPSSVICAKYENNYVSEIIKLEIILDILCLENDTLIMHKLSSRNKKNK